MLLGNDKGQARDDPLEFILSMSKGPGGYEGQANKANDDKQDEC